MLSSQEEQAERRRVFAQDQSVQRQATTMHQFAQADAQTPRGRFSQIDAAYVVGSTALPQYPQASTPFQRDPVPDEPPLSAHDNPALEVASIVSTPQAPDPTSDAPSTPLGQRDVGSLSSQPNPATVDPSVPSDVERRVGLGPFSGDPSSVLAGPRDTSRVVGSPVPYRRF